MTRSEKIVEFLKAEYGHEFVPYFRKITYEIPYNRIKAEYTISLHSKQPVYAFVARTKAIMETANKKRAV